MRDCYPHFLTKGELAMSEPVGPSKKFMQMGIVEKIVFAVKLVVFLASFGFAFPTLLSD
jgi:hypothetical protein